MPTPATHQVWVALAPIFNGQFRAFNQGDIVPDTVEARFDYSGQGLVARLTVADGTEPTFDETAVAYLRDVVTKTSLHIGSTAPLSPALGSVWIDTSL